MRLALRVDVLQSRRLFPYCYVRRPSQAALWALRDMTAASPDNINRAAAAGGLEAIVQALKAHKLNAGCMQAGCWALQIMTDKSDANAARVRSSLVALTEGMKIRPSDSQSISSQAVTAGGAEAVAAVLSKHVELTSVQAAGCAALASIAARSADNAQRVASAGGVAAAVGAMRAHPSAVAVQKAACLLLRALTHRCPSVHEEVGSLGGVELIVLSLRRHAASEAVCGAACAALVTLTTSSGANVSSACGAGGLDVVVAALRSHASSAAVQAMGCSAIANIAGKGRESVKMAERAGAVAAAQAALAAFPNLPAVKEAAGRAVQTVQAGLLAASGGSVRIRGSGGSSRAQSVASDRSGHSLPHHRRGPKSEAVTPAGISFAHADSDSSPSPPRREQRSHGVQHEHAVEALRSHQPPPPEPSG